MDWSTSLLQAFRWFPVFCHEPYHSKYADKSIFVWLSNCVPLRYKPRSRFDKTNCIKSFCLCCQTMLSKSMTYSTSYSSNNLWAGQLHYTLHSTPRSQAFFLWSLPGWQPQNNLLFNSQFSDRWWDAFSVAFWPFLFPVL